MGRDQKASPADEDPSSRPVDEAGTGRPARGIRVRGLSVLAGNPIARVAVVLVALAVVALAGEGAVDATKQGARATDRANTASGRLFMTQLKTVGDQLAEQVPAGSTVFVPSDLGSLWTQRLVELATMHGIIAVTDEADAEFVLSLVKVPAATSPGGFRLVAIGNR